MDDVDLVRLNWTIWDEHQNTGYRQLWISRIDGRSLSAREQERLEAAVERDFHHDYSEDELQLVFFPEVRYLRVEVTDLDEPSPVMMLRAVSAHERALSS